MKLLILADKHIEANSDDFLDGHSLDVGDVRTLLITSGSTMVLITS